MKRTISLLIICFAVLFDCVAQEERRTRYCEDKAQDIMGVSIGGYGRVVVRHILYPEERAPYFFEARLNAQNEISLKVIRLIAQVSIRAGREIDDSVKAAI